MVDHGARAAVTSTSTAFLENVNWEVVEQRYKDSKAGRFTRPLLASAHAPPAGAPSSSS